MAQNDPSSEKPRKQGIPKRIPFWDQFRNQFWVEFELKIMVSGKVPGAIWHYYSNGFRVLKGSALLLAAEPLRDRFWTPFWSTFWSQNPNKIVQRAARNDFGATQEAREGEEIYSTRWWIYHSACSNCLYCGVHNIMPLWWTQPLAFCAPTLSIKLPCTDGQMRRWCPLNNWSKSHYIFVTF